MTRVSPDGLQPFLTLSPDAVLVIDGDGLIRDLNPEAARLFATSRDALLGTAVEVLLPPAEPQPLVAVRPDGSSFPVEVSLSPIDLGGEVVVAAVVRDVSEVARHAADARLWAQVFETAEWAVAIVDADGATVRQANAAFARMHGYPVEELAGLASTALSAPNARLHLETEVAAAQPPDRVVYESVHQRKDGTAFPVVVDVAAVHGDDGRPLFRAVNVRDVTERKWRERALAEARAHLAHLVTHDPLTGLPNRPLLFDRIERALEHARRNGSRLALLFVDLDHFQRVNDSLGHSAGDQVLATVAARIRATLRPTDSAGRHSGDEFVVLLEGLDAAAPAAEADANVVAQRVGGALAEPIKVGIAAQVHLTASFGIAVSTSSTAGAEELLRQADAALHDAKARGRAARSVYRPTADVRAFDALALEAELRRALAEDEFELHYQPIVDTAAGHVVAAEALLRWRHPRRGLLAPDAFLDVLEDTGLIVPVSRRMLDQACATIAAVRATGADLAVSVNVSGRQLGSGELPADVLAALAAYDLPPDAIELEITENTLIGADGVAAADLQRLAAAGVRIGLDDFGTGYGALSYLQRFPVSFVKIDRSFVSGLAANDQDRAIVKGVVGLARAMQIAVVAEGVEHPEQLDALRALGCDRVQGWLLGRPVTAAALRHRLDRDRGTPSA